MLLKARFGLKLLVMSRRVAPAGKTRSSPAFGTRLPLQFAFAFQFPLELPSQVLVAALAEKFRSASRQARRSPKLVFIASGFAEFVLLPGRNLPGPSRRRQVQAGRPNTTRWSIEPARRYARSCLQIESYPLVAPISATAGAWLKLIRTLQGTSQNKGHILPWLSFATMRYC